MSPINEGRRRWFWLRALIVALVVCRGLVYLAVLPLFEGWDEYEHVGYIVHVVETGRPPVPGQTNVPPSLLAKLVTFPLPRCVVDLQLGRLGAVDYRAYWAGGRTPRLLPGTMELYEAQHGWSYYRLVAPLFRAIGGVSDLKRSVGGLRLLNLAFLAASVWIALGVIGRLVKSPAAAALIGVAVAAQPLFLINGIRVANDALGVLLGTLVVAAAFGLGSTRWPLRCVALGVATGLAVLVKAVSFGLVPFVAAAWLAFVVRERFPVSRAAMAGLAIALGFLAVTQHDLRTNLSRYGGLTPMQEAVLNRSRGRTTTDLIATARMIRWDKQVRRLWLRDTFFAGGWSNQGPAPAWVSAYSYCIGAGLLGYVIAGLARGRSGGPVFQRADTPVLCAVLCLGFTAAMAYHMVQSTLAWGRSTTCPWYASPALPWFVLLAAGGGLSWPIGRLRPIVPLALSAVCLLTEVVVVWSRMIVTYSGGATGMLALSRLASLQPTFLGTATLLAAQAGVAVIVVVLVVVGTLRGRSPEAGRSWLAGSHLRLRSTKQGEAEASPWNSQRPRD